MAENNPTTPEAGGFGCAVTGAGLRLIAKAIANETDLRICKVLVGSGTPPEGVYIGDLTDLVEPVALAAASEPVRSGTTVSLFVEYRSDMNGGLKEGFIIREFGVFALDGEEEVLIYYGDLSKYPQYIGPYTGCQDVRRYPISLTIAEGSQVKLEGLPGVVMTREDMKAYFEAVLLPQLLPRAERGAPGGVAGLDGRGKVPEAQLPWSRYIAAVRPRTPGKPAYGLGGGGEDGGGSSAVLETGPYTGTTEAGVVVSGVLYDAKNVSTRGDAAPDGTILIKTEEQEHGEREVLSGTDQAGE